MASKFIEALKDKCKGLDVTLTEQREVIASVIDESDDHPNIEEIHSRVIKKNGAIGLATVYRAVKLFEDIGVIEKYDFRDGKSSRYEKVLEGHHDHLIDVRSGKIIEFHHVELERLKNEIAKKLGYKLVDHRLELYAVPIDDSKVNKGDKENKDR